MTIIHSQTLPPVAATETIGDVGTGLGFEDTVHHRVSSFPHLQRVLEILEADVRIEEAQHNALGAAHFENQNDCNDARRAEAVAHANAASVGAALPDAHAASYASKTARAKRSLDEARLRLKEGSQHLGNAREALDAALEYLAGVPDLSVLETVPVSFPASKDARTVMYQAESETRTAQADKEAIRRRPAPKEDILASAMARVARAAAGGGMPTVRPDGSLEWPLTAINPAGSGTSMFAVPDPLSLFLSDKATLARVRAHVAKSVDDLYADINDAASPADKKRLTAECDARILAANRLEAHCVNVLRQRGERVSYRRGLDVRSILGVSGPRPPKRTTR
ncbi:MAG: hypothetical protein ABL879_06210 [Devosia sp.]